MSYSPAKSLLSNIHAFTAINSIGNLKPRSISGFSIKTSRIQILVFSVYPFMLVCSAAAGHLIIPPCIDGGTFNFAPHSPLDSLVIVHAVHHVVYFTRAGQFIVYRRRSFHRLFRYCRALNRPRRPLAAVLSEIMPLLVFLTVR